MSQIVQQRVSNVRGQQYYYEVQPCQISKFDYKEIKAMSNSLREEDFFK